MSTSTRGAVLAILVVLLMAVETGPAMAAAHPAMPSDFNGDGYADLAIGTPSEGSPGAQDGASGAVNVLYGSSRGLTAVGDQLWNQATPGVKGERAKSERFGAALASGDFDADGFADLAIGVPRDRPVGDARIGAVNVLYGTPRGLSAGGDQLWSQANLPDTGEWLDDFGAALAAGDFDGDGFWDLAIGVPGEVDEASGQVGAVDVLFGGPAGLQGRSARVLTSLTPPVRSPDWCPRFAEVLAAGDLDGDGDADLAVGAPGGCSDGGGQVETFAGAEDRALEADHELWSQDTPGVEDEAEPDEWFGATLAIGDFDADGYGDLAVGVPYEGAVDLGGAVAILPGSATGVTADGDQLWGVLALGIPAEEVGNGAFGATLAAGDLNGDAADDLAIGVDTHEGAVVTMLGSPSGLSDVGARLWTQDTPGVPGTSETPDGFGLALAIGDYGRSHHADLAVGVPREKVGRDIIGRVVTLYGTASGLATEHVQSWTQDSPGVKDKAENRDFFGSTLADWSIFARE